MSGPNKRGHSVDSVSGAPSGDAPNPKRRKARVHNSASGDGGYATDAADKTAPDNISRKEQMTSDADGSKPPQAKKYMSKFERKKAKKQAQTLQRQAQAKKLQEQTRATRGGEMDQSLTNPLVKRTSNPGKIESASGIQPSTQQTKAKTSLAKGNVSQKGAKKNAIKATNTPQPLSAAAQCVLDSFTLGATASTGTTQSKGTLSDRLNPDHKYYDAPLKAQWKTFSKRERACIVAVDKENIAQHTQTTTNIQHPFTANPDDHCESPFEAYQHIEGVLALIAEVKGCSRAQLRIYDPYYCAGAMTRHLGELGFTNVYNKCEDFYQVIADGKVPEHDVVVTNPPYSGDHVDKLLQWVTSNSTPFLLLMPNYFCAKPYYAPALGGKDRCSSTMSYLCPRKRYNYWTPKGMREADKVQKQHTGAGGYRTSPFISFWYINLLPMISREDVLAWDRAQRDTNTSNRLSTQAVSDVSGNKPKKKTVKKALQSGQDMSDQNKATNDGVAVSNAQSVHSSWKAAHTCLDAIVVCTGDTLPPGVQPGGFR